MKKLFSDKKSTQADTAITKDNRMLVLFLLGLTLLSFEFWPFKDGDVRCSYHVLLDENSHPWRVIALPTGDILNQQEIVKAFALKEESKIFPLVPENKSIGEIPAVLSLFINRPLEINRAEKEVLEMLPGVGPYVANNIFAEIQRQGKFSSPDDLLKVSGIGTKSMQRLLPLISFE
jgi:hypothetical protein